MKHAFNSSMSRERKYLAGLFFTALLIFGQAAALAHQLEHDTDDCEDFCSECLRHSVFNGLSLAGETSIPVREPYSLIILERQDDALPAAPSRSYRVRAPPTLV